jgi:hypothetical protein
MGLIGIPAIFQRLMEKLMEILVDNIKTSLYTLTIYLSTPKRMITI